MASIKKCLSKIKGFTRIKAEELISRTEEYQAEGMNQEDAARKVILEEYGDLNDRLNEIKSQLRIPKANVLKYNPEEAVKKVEEEFDKKDKEEKDKAAKEQFEADKKMAEDGKVAVIQEGMTEEDYAKDVLENSENAGQIAQAWAGLKDELQGKKDQGSMDAAYAFFKENRLSQASVEGMIGSNVANAKNIPAFRSYVAVNGGVDADLADRYGFNVTAEQLIDFMMTYPNGINEYEAIVNKGMRGKLAGKFQRLTGKRLTKDLADRIEPLFNNYYDEIEQSLLAEQGREEVFRDEGKFQKKKESSQIENKDVDKVVERMKKSLPKFSITYNPELEQAGKISGNKIEINPFYAGTDTPIHEAGHALIDFIGYNNKVIQTGIKQLKDTDLWKKTKERYSELSEEELGKEVLAEAIGLEGAGIFDTEAKKTRFKAVLDYIFTKLKQLLGIDKNIAKSLAKQIIGGVGTKEIETAQESAQKPKGEKKKAEPLSPEAQKVKDLYDDIKDIEDLSAIPYQDLVDAYNFVITNEEFSRTADGKKAKQEFLKRIGANFFEVASDKVKTDPNYSPEKAAKKDISGLDKLFKVLSHFNAEFPELKELSAMFNKAYFNKIKEAAEKKKVNLELAKEVIKEKNRQMGVVDWAKEKALSLIWNRNYKYFDYLDDGKGNIITVDEAKKKNLSKAQIDYLKFVRNTIAARAGVVENLEDNWNTEMQVLKTDKKFYENMATENAVSAVFRIVFAMHVRYHVFRVENPFLYLFSFLF